MTTINTISPVTIRQQTISQLEQTDKNLTNLIGTKRKGLLARLLFFDADRFEGQAALKPLEKMSRDLIDELPKKAKSAANELRKEANRHPLHFRKLSLGGALLGGAIAAGAAFTGLASVPASYGILAGMTGAGVFVQRLFNGTRYLAKDNLKMVKELLTHLKKPHN